MTGGGWAKNEVSGNSVCAGALERIKGRLAWGQQNELWKGVGRKRKFAEEERD
jgi:hypothetical protein